eukprot:4104795-Lingulodinium_polyedra.AAC.1
MFQSPWTAPVAAMRSILLSPWAPRCVGASPGICVTPHLDRMRRRAAAASASAASRGRTTSMLTARRQ